MTIETSFDSNYRKVSGGRAPRAPVAERLPGAGRHPSNKACRIAQEEIEAGKICLREERSRGDQAAGRRSGRPDPAELSRTASVLRGSQCERVAGDLCMLS